MEEDDPGSKCNSLKFPQEAQALPMANEETLSGRYEWCRGWGLGARLPTPPLYDGAFEKERSGPQDCASRTKLQRVILRKPE